VRERKPAPFVLAIAGFDPSCGAGLVADARSIEAMGALPLAVATAITVQSGSGVRASKALPPAQVSAQLDELLRSLPVAAVKIGQVPNAVLARAIARRLAAARLPVVLDPVLVASGGGRLAAAGTMKAIASSLVPLASLVTVNLAEASSLTGRRVTNLAAMRAAAAAIEAMGAGAVLVKGGHLRGDPVDVLRQDGREQTLEGRRIAGSMHGTGCALASAAAARIGCGDDVDVAVKKARDHVRNLIRGAVPAGKGRLRGGRSD
jgi:hydroxymethylpyrimidine kinase/phosphomethylpyrimidine kinase